MDRSRFCIIPRGNTPWTRRFFDAIVRGCVPVVLSNPVAFPFEAFIDFTSLTIKLPEHWAPNLPAELRAVNESMLALLQRGVHRYRRAFTYDGGHAFDLFLIELAARMHGLSRLQMGKGATPNSATQFWAPGRGPFTLADAVKVGPSWGAGAVPH